MSTSVNDMTEYASILFAEVRSQSQTLLFLRATAIFFSFFVRRKVGFTVFERKVHIFILSLVSFPSCRRFLYTPLLRPAAAV